MAIREEHQTELTHNRVERPIRKGYRLGHPLLPVDSGRKLVCHRQHVENRIESEDRSGRARSRVNFTGKDSGSAGNVQHLVVALDLRRVRDFRRPLSK